MPVRKSKRGWIFQVVVHKPDGSRERIFGTPGVPGPYHDLARTKVGALEAEKRAIASALRGDIEVRKESKTLNEHADTFLKLYKPEGKPAAHRDRKASMKHLLPHFGQLTPDAVKQTDVDAFVVAQLASGAARKSINNRLGALSSLIEYATGEECTLRLHVGGMRSEIHAVDVADVEKLLAACTDPRYRVVILLAYEAGLRAGEIRGLQHGDVRDGQLTVRRALDQETDEVIAPKHDKVRTVPISPRLIEALDALPRRGIWIVSKADGSFVSYRVVSDAVKAIYDRAGVPRPVKPIHCLRHTFGTVMARRVPLGVLQQLMGHADVTTTMRYVDVSEADKRDAIALVFGGATPVQAGRSEAT